MTACTPEKGGQCEALRGSGPNASQSREGSANRAQASVALDTANFDLEATFSRLSQNR